MYSDNWGVAQIQSADFQDKICQLIPEGGLMKSMLLNGNLTTIFISERLHHNHEEVEPFEGISSNGTAERFRQNDLQQVWFCTMFLSDCQFCTELLINWLQKEDW